MSIIRPRPLAQSVKPRDEDQDDPNTQQAQDSEYDDLMGHDRLVRDIAGGDEREVLEGGGGREGCWCHCFGGSLLDSVEG